MSSSENMPRRPMGLGGGRGLARGGEKPQNTKKALTELAMYVTPWYGPIVVAAFAACVGRLSNYYRAE